MFNFKKYLVESSKSLYCDLDGVLVDFAGGYIKNAGADIPENIISGDSNEKFLYNFEEYLVSTMGKKVGKKKFWSYAIGHDFWANLEWMKDGKQLWENIKKYNPTILSAPSRDIGCITGKKEWVKRNLGESFEKTMILEKDKWKYAEENKILIDDSERKITPWIEHGGIGILHKNTLETINRLDQILSI